MKKLQRSNSLGSILHERQPAYVGREFLRIFIVLFVVVAGIVALYAHNGYQRSLLLHEKEAAEHLKLLKFSMIRDLEVLVTDLHVVADSDTLNTYVNSPAQTTRAALENRFAVFTDDRKIYNQVRYLDQQGMEIVRINYSSGNVEISPPGLLQSKRDRYYFQATRQKKPGEIFLSSLDLNVEQGKVEEPYTPTLRLATPIFDIARESVGIVVLNYNAEMMLDRLTASAEEEHATEYYLLNQNGFWLKASNPGVEYGEQLEHGRSFAKSYPDVWEKLTSGSIAKAHTGAGLFLFEIVHPLAELDAKKISGPAETEPQKWILVAHVPSQELSFFNYLLRLKSVFAALLGIFILLAVGAWQIAVSRASGKSSSASIRLLSQGLIQSPAAVVITDRRGRILYVNPRFEKLTGYTLQEVRGENPRILKSGSTADTVYADLWQTIKRGEIWAGDFENKDKTGRPYYVSAQISPIVSEDGSVDYFIGLQEDVTEKVELHRRLEIMATTDSLTGAFNRGRFIKLCEQESRRLARYQRPLCMLLFDLDHFKNINDTYGHHGGDRVLVQFVEQVKKTLRESDIFGRVGGEEFAALVVETEKVGALLLAERLRRVVEDMQIEYQGRTMNFTVSIGCTEWIAADKHVDEVLKRADKALYRAKEQGRNRVEFC